MKDEEFNNFLRERADSFELKPSSGSFAAVQRKMQYKNKRRRIIVFFSLLVGTLAGAYFMFLTEKTEGAPPIVVTTNTPSHYEQLNQDPNTAELGNGEGMLNDKAYDNSNSIKPSTTVVNQAIRANTSKTKKQYTQNTEKGIDKTKTSSDADNGMTDGILATTTNQDIPASDVINTSINKDTEATNNEPIQETIVAKKVDIEPESKKGTSTTDSTVKRCNCNESKWAVKAYYNPFSVFYLNLADKKEDQIINSRITVSDVEEYSEELNSGWSAGLKAERKLSTKWKLGFGVAYNKWSIDQVRRNINYSKDSVENYAFDPISNQNIVTGYTVYSLPNVNYSARANISLQSIQLPIYANYTFATKKRWQFDINGGFTTSYLVAGKYTEVYSTQSQIGRNNFQNNTSILQTYRRLNVNMALGLTINYKISNCTSMYVGQTFSAPLFTIRNKNTQLPARPPLFMGIETGIKINF